MQCYDMDCCGVLFNIVSCEALNINVTICYDVLRRVVLHVLCYSMLCCVMVCYGVMLYGVL